ncbi:cysteine desulfurase [Candidatus Saccharibacteria bacterium]|nr:cysteine desulfurase [Candidatus Saccharibacteria bacterium]
MNQRSLYFDYAAATPVDEAVLEMMLPYFSDKFYNPSAVYLLAKEVSVDLSNARAKVAQLLGVRPVEIIFTAGGTEANNLAICGVMNSFKNAHIVVSAVEHDSILQPSSQYSHSLAPVDNDGLINLQLLKKSITDKTVLVSVMYVNNEIGTVMSLPRIAKIIQEIRVQRSQQGNEMPLYFHVDAAQAPLYFDIHVKRLGVDMMTLNGGKIYGAKQSGVLYVNSMIKLSPQITGGGQEFNRRSGTQNIANIVGFAEALQRAQKNYKNTHNNMSQMQAHFIGLLNSSLPHIKINGSLKYRSPNNVHITVPGVDNERLMMELDERGVMCAVGSACSASNDQPSHVLRAIGLSDKDAQASLRFTMGKTTSLSDIDYVVSLLQELT